MLKRNCKRLAQLVTVLLAVAVIVGFAPQSGRQAFAADEDPAAVNNKVLSLTLTQDTNRKFTGTCSADFNVEFWTEENGIKIPLANESLSVQEASTMADLDPVILDSDGKGTIPVQLPDSLGYKTILIWAPENCYYKVSLTNNTPDIALMEYSVSGASEASGQMTNGGSAIWYARGKLNAYLTLVLVPIYCTETCSIDFNAEFWSESDGTKIPLAGETISIVSGSLDSGEEILTLDSGGKIKIPYQVNESYKSVTFKVPVWNLENSYYTITPTNNTPDAAIVGYTTSGAGENTGKISSTSVWYAIGKSPMTVIKEDQNGNPVEGARLEIRDKDGNVLDSWTSGSESHVSNLAYTHDFNSNEEYTLTETYTPDGYLSAQDFVFKWYNGAGAVTVSDNQRQGDTIHLLNAKQAGDLTVKAVYDDDGTNAVLKSNAVFGIQIVIKNIPLMYTTTGMKIEDAYVFDYSHNLGRQGWGFADWLGQGTAYIPETKSTMLDSSFFIRMSIDKCFTSFVVWLKPGETFTLHGIPEGAEYEVKEVSEGLKGAPPGNSNSLFDITYNNKNGTATDSDVDISVINTLRTLEMRMSKEVFGYDSGKPVYIHTMLPISSYNSSNYRYYESINPTFIGCDGVERSFFKSSKTNHSTGVIPLRSDGKETVIKTIREDHCPVSEYVPNTDVDPGQYTYEELVNDIEYSDTMALFEYGQGDQRKTGYHLLITPMLTGPYSEDLVLYFKNASRLIAFQTVDEKGKAVAGAHMQILDKENDEVLFDWISSENRPYEVNTIDSNRSDSWVYGKTFVLHEVEPATGYEPAEDIEFTVKKHEGTTEKYDEFGVNTGTVTYYYPYIDTGDGEETLVLKTENVKIEAPPAEDDKTPAAPAADPATQMGADGTPVGPGASAEAAERAITNMVTDDDPQGTVFGKLTLKSPKQTKTSINLSWTKVNGAVSYVIFGNKCGKGIKPIKLGVVNGTKQTVSTVANQKVVKGTYYKFIVVALDKDNKVVSTSKVIHVATKGGKVGNHKKVTVKSSVVKKAKKLKKGKSLKLKAKAVPQTKKLKVKKHVGIRYESTNINVATVTKKGAVKAKSKGTCFIYAYAQNGVFKKIKVVIK